MSSEKCIEAEAIKTVREVPLINNQVDWNVLLNSGVISLDEIIAISNHISESTSAPNLNVSDFINPSFSSIIASIYTFRLLFVIFAVGLVLSPVPCRFLPIPHYRNLH